MNKFSTFKICVGDGRAYVYVPRITDKRSNNLDYLFRLLNT